MRENAPLDAAYHALEVSRMARSFGSSRLVPCLILAALALSGLAGCVNRARVTVTHPAMLNADPYGSTYTVGQFQDRGWYAAARQVEQLLHAHLAQSVDPSIRDVATGGGLVISGEVTDQTYQEWMTSEARTCSRQVRVGTDQRGNPTYRTESYSCVEIIRHGQFHVGVRFVIVATGNGGATLYDYVYEDAMETSTSRMQNDQSRGEPNPIDVNGGFADLNSRVVQRFSRVILPWQEVVEIQLEDCDDDGDLCEQGITLVRQGDLAGASQLFGQVVAPFESEFVEIPPGQVAGVAEAFFNRGVARGYQGLYQEGLADLTRAVQMAPDRDHWAEELDALTQLAAEYEAFRSQSQR